MSKFNSANLVSKSDDSAFDNFFESFYPTLVVFAQKYVSDIETAEDVCQDVFLKVYLDDKTLRKFDNIKAYLYTLTKNSCHNYLKHNKVKNKFRNAKKHEKEMFFKDTLMEQETYRILYEAINSLPERSKEIIELSLNGLSNPQIAEELNVSINTVKSSKLKSYQRLRELLKEHKLAILFLLKILNS